MQILVLKVAHLSMKPRKQSNLLLSKHTLHPVSITEQIVFKKLNKSRNSLSVLHFYSKGDQQEVEKFEVGKLEVGP